MDGYSTHTKYISQMTDAAPPEAVSRDQEHSVVVVLGPTGSGKSDLALRIAEDIGAAEIVNFDSVQVYRGFDIGSAKLPVPERRGVPHHIIDVADPAGEITAGSYARMARAVLAEITARRARPVLVGGTGFYLRALVDGLSPAPERDQAVRNRLESLAARRPLALHRFLRRFDPEASVRIHQNDRQKLIRAVEMMLLQRRPATETQSAPRNRLTGYRILKLGLNPDRAALHERLNQRSLHMFEAGLLEETRCLLEAGVPEAAKPMQSLGYKQAVAALRGHVTVADAVAECQTRTRQYAKRQMTWFRREKGVRWLCGFGSDPGIQREALALVRSELKLPL